MKTFSPTTRASAFLLAQLGSFSNALLLAGAMLIVPPLVHRVIGMRAQSSAPSFSSAPPTVDRRAVRAAAEGDALGRIEIPRIGMDLAVFEGASEATLRKGPGHISGTPWTGGLPVGNCVIAGHRDSFFRPLEKARIDDVVRLTGQGGVRSYRLVRRQVVKPRDLSALASTAEPRLTLITCYPFRWWGPAPLRLVWTAELLESGPRPGASGASATY
jgi:sortase A